MEDRDMENKGQALVDAIEAHFAKYLCFDGPNDALVVAMWALMTWTFHRFYSIPYLGIGGKKNTGKSTLLTALAGVCKNATTMVASSSAPMFRKLLSTGGELTILIDEAEGNSKESKDTIGAFMNAGYKRGTTISKVIGKDVIDFPVFCPKAFAAIGDLNDALRSRAIRVWMERGKPAADYFGETADIEAMGLVQAIKSTVLPIISTVEAVYPSFLTARDREIWGAIFGLATALRVDARTMDRLTQAAADNSAIKTQRKITLQELTASEGDWIEQEYSRRLLNDILLVVREDETKIGSADLAHRLINLPTGPWRRFKGESLDVLMLANLLALRGVQPTTVDLSTRENGKRIVRKAKGYKIAQLREAAARGNG
jgi:energy-coupling factor transporter ATP-binding protein EcfA2